MLNFKVTADGQALFIDVLAPSSYLTGEPKLLAIETKRIVQRFKNEHRSMMYIRFTNKYNVKCVVKVKPEEILYSDENSHYVTTAFDKNKKYFKTKAIISAMYNKI